MCDAGRTHRPTVFHVSSRSRCVLVHVKVLGNVCPFSKHQHESTHPKTGLSAHFLQSSAHPDSCVTTASFVQCVLKVAVDETWPDWCQRFNLYPLCLFMFWSFLPTLMWVSSLALLSFHPTVCQTFVLETQCSPEEVSVTSHWLQFSARSCLWSSDTLMCVASCNLDVNCNMTFWRRQTSFYLVLFSKRFLLFFFLSSSFF